MKLFFSSSVKLERRDFRIHELSGARTAPLGSVKPADESNAIPLPSEVVQFSNWAVILLFLFAVRPNAGGIISINPSAVSSIRKSSFIAQNSANCPSVSLITGSSLTIKGAIPASTLSSDGRVSVCVMAASPVAIAVYRSVVLADCLNPMRGLFHSRRCRAGVPARRRQSAR